MLVFQEQNNEMNSLSFLHVFGRVVYRTRWKCINYANQRNLQRNVKPEMAKFTHVFFVRKYYTSNNFCILIDWEHVNLPQTAQKSEIAGAKLEISSAKREIGSAKRWNWKIIDSYGIFKQNSSGPNKMADKSETTFELTK